MIFQFIKQTASDFEFFLLFNVGKEVNVYNAIYDK